MATSNHNANSAVLPSQQSPFKVQIGRASTRMSYGKPPEELPAEAMQPPIPSAYLGGFEGADEYGNACTNYAWFVDVADLSGLVNLMHETGHRLLVEHAHLEEGDGCCFVGGTASPDAAMVITIIDDWVEVNR